MVTLEKKKNGESLPTRYYESSIFYIFLNVGNNVTTLKKYQSIVKTFLFKISTKKKKKNKTKWSVSRDTRS